MQINVATYKIKYIFIPYRLAIIAAITFCTSCAAFFINCITKKHITNPVNEGDVPIATIALRHRLYIVTRTTATSDSTAPNWLIHRTNDLLPHKNRPYFTSQLIQVTYTII